MIDQTVQIKYIGTAQRWPEISITGRQSVWMPGQIESRSKAEAAYLLATGLFSSPPVPVTAVTGPGGGNRLLAGNLPADMAQLSNVVVSDGALQSWTANGINYVATYAGGKVATITTSDGWVQTYTWAGDVPTITVAEV